MAVRQKKDRAGKPQRLRSTPARPPKTGIGMLLRDADAAFNRYLTAQLAVHGVTFGQFQHLRNLWVENGLTQAELSRRIGIEMASSTAILDSLEAAKLITRMRNTADRRKINVFFDSGRRRTGEGANGLRRGRQQARKQRPHPGRGRLPVRAGRADHREFQDAAVRQCLFRKGRRPLCAETPTHDRAARTGAPEHAAGGGMRLCLSPCDDCLIAVLD